jgi:mediator of RNA polymerase II transcription subunit 7
MMQDQVERSRAETRGIREMKEKVETILEGLSQAKLDDTSGDVVQEVLPEEGADIWKELEKEFS